MLNIYVEQIKQEINKGNIKIISFDIFDTLVVRPAVVPEDMFRIVAKRCDYDDYTRLRISAEKSLRKKRDGLLGDITLEEIYREFHAISQLPYSFVQTLMETEQSIELEYLMPRKAIKEIYNYVLDKNIKVIFSSDMYLPKKTIEQILIQNGYNEYDKIYLSCDCQAKKTSGKMYDIILKDYDFISKPSEVLHIGDNYYSDFVQAKRKKIKAIHVKKEMDMLRKYKNLYSIINNSINSDNSFLVGTFAHYFLEDVHQNQINLNKTLMENYFVLSLLKFIAPKKNDFYNFSNTCYEVFNTFVEQALYGSFAGDIVFNKKKYSIQEVTAHKEIADSIALKYAEVFKSDCSKLSYDKQFIYIAAAEFFINDKKGIKRINNVLPSLSRKSMYNLLYRIAVRAGIKNVIKKVYYKIKTIGTKSTPVFTNSSEYFKGLSNSIENVDTNSKKPTILFFGDNADFDKGTCSLINNIYNEVRSEYNFILVNEGYMKKQSEVSIMFDCKVINMPKELSKNFYYPYKEFASDKSVSDGVKEEKCINESFENLYNKFFDMDKNFTELKVFYSNEYINNIIERYAPSIVFMWNKFHWQNHLVDCICKQKAIKTVYVEFGVLPGTFCIEQKGQMGESWVAQEAENFLDISVTEKELGLSENLISHLQSSKLNRNSQPVSGRKFETLKNKLKKGRPTIFVAGQNDYESGIIPYTRNTCENHSPVFASSNDSVVYIAQLAKKNDWNLVYKPHPTIFEKCAKTLPKNIDNIVVVNDVDINDVIDISDVTITILSQVSYLALIRSKPVVMLGYNQLKGKKCTYEAYSKEKIEESILCALRGGYDRENKLHFTKHVAQLCKTYLLNNSNDDATRYTKSIGDGIREIIS